MNEQFDNTKTWVRGSQFAFCYFLLARTSYSNAFPHSNMLFFPTWFHFLLGHWGRYKTLLESSVCMLWTDWTGWATKLKFRSDTSSARMTLRPGRQRRHLRESWTTMVKKITHFSIGVKAPNLICWESIWLLCLLLSMFLLLFLLLLLLLFRWPWAGWVWSGVLSICAMGLWITSPLQARNFDLQERDFLA